MKNETGISCPISGIKGDEKVIRMVAFMVVLLALASLYFRSPVISFILAYDFGMRTFNNGDYSPLKVIAVKISSLLNLKSRPTDLAPKKFAALIGYAFSVTIFVLQLFDVSIATYITGSILIVCALLESMFSFCVGCMVYAQLQRFKQ